MHLRQAMAVGLMALGLATLPEDGFASRVIQANPAGGTYCAGAPVACGTPTIVTRWWQNPVPFWVNQDAAADAADVGLTQADILAASQAAYQSWEDVPLSIIKFAYVGETTARIAADGTNTTVWYDAVLDADCSGSLGAPSGVLAVTILTESAGTGEITDADVLMDSADTWLWSPACASFDVQSVLTHEYGHSLGIHHTELAGLPVATRPSMTGGYFCDAGVASQRTLEADDRSAVECLYPESPAVVLMDQTGSMATGNRMADAQTSANAFVDDLADNTMSVAAFADVGCGRTGYELLQDWTDSVVDLHNGVLATSACGNTPLWESACCALGKAVELAPSSVLVVTDTAENSSDAVCSADCPSGYCGCLSNLDAYNMYNGTNVSVYVIDVSTYFGTGSFSVKAGTPPPGQEGGQCNQVPPNEDGRKLQSLARLTGGLYCAANNESELERARLAIERHLARFSKQRRNPPTCQPKLPIDNIQVYDTAGLPASPFAGQTVTLNGIVTMSRRTIDAGTMYIEDCTGGIRLYDTLGPAVNVGDRVTVAGRVGTFLGELRLSPVQYVRPEGADRPVLSPIISPADALNFELVGRQITVLGYAAGDIVGFRFSLTSRLGSGPTLTVLVDPDTGITPDAVEKGGQYVVSGILSIRNGQLELVPRRPEDIDRP